MTSIYQLSNDYLDHIDEIAELIENDEEVSFEKALMAIGLQDSIKAKAVNTAKYVKNLNGSIDAIDAEIKRLTARKKTIEKRADWLKGLIMFAMNTAKVTKIDDDILPLRIQENSQWVVNVTDPDALPAKYKSVVKITKVDKKLLLANKDKLRTKAVTFTKGSHLRIGT